MCGIVGFINLDGRPAQKRLIEEMTLILKHRGPDDSGNYAEAEVALGHRRLSVIDPSPAGHQPMVNEDGSLWITYNGEVYNYREIRAVLEAKGYSFKSKTDTEVVLKGFEEWGVNCLEKFNGMFALAIWDEKHRRMVLARDRLGIKPLYYFLSPELFVFASEIKALLVHPHISIGVNDTAVFDYLHLKYVVAPNTMFKDILKLRPGHYMVIEQGHCTIRKFWDILSKAKDKRLYPFEYYKEKNEDLLKKSTRRRLVSDVPLGAFLSGGVDSSTIVNFFSQEVSEPVRTFSVGFGQGRPVDEVDHARLVSRHLETEHHELTILPDAVNALSRIMYHLEEPLADPAIIPTFFLAEFSKRFVTVVLSGEGSDETNGGYDRYVVEIKLGIIELFRRLPRFGKDLMDRLFFNIPQFRKLQFASQSVFNFLTISSIFNPAMGNSMLQEDFRSEFLEYRHPYADLYEDLGSLDLKEVLLLLDLQTLLPDDLLLKVDKMTMAHSLEARVPFLDHELVEFVLTIPIRSRVRRTETKAVLRSVSRSYLPPQICRRRQHGFHVPIEEWLKGDLKDILLELLQPDKVERRGYIKGQFVNTLVSEYLAGQRHLALPVWNLFMLELWFREFVDRGFGPLCGLKYN